MSQKIQSTKNKSVFTYHHPAGFTREVVFVVNTYASNGNLYVGLEEAHTGDLFTDVTKNIEKLGGHLVNIKNTDENDGMAQFLIDNRMGTLLGTMDEQYPMFLFDAHNLATANRISDKK